MSGGAVSWRKPFRRMDFTPPEQDALHEAGIHEALAVWAAAAEEPSQPLARLEKETGIPRGRLQDVLFRAGLREVNPAHGGVAARHWLDASLLAGVAVLAWLALREPPRPARPHHLRAGEVIAAFQLMDTAWVMDTVAPAPEDAIESRAAAQGRVLLRTLAAGQAITEAHLGPALPAGALDGRSVLALNAVPTPPDAEPRAGTRIGLMLTPRDPRGGGGGAVIGDALVLSAAPTDSALSLLVALRTADLPAAAALLGNADVHVVATPP